MIIVERIGATGYLKLDRPKALNALNMQMIDQLADGLQQHLSDNQVSQIVVCSAGPGAFCAGGDVKHIRSLALDGELEQAARFFRHEYALNQAIAEANKPYIALIDGAAMGGGIGISAHGSHRILTERALLAMPETAIGLFPDVGGSYFLPRLKFHAGYWMGLSGARVDGTQGVIIGLGTHRIESDQITGMLADLEAGKDLDDVLEQMSESNLDAAFERDIGAVEQVFGAESLDELRRLLAETIDRNPDNRLLYFGQKGIAHGSPHSLEVTFDLLKAGESASIADCLEREYDAVMKMIQHPDFAEGVRAMLVDKDRAPRWHTSETSG